MLLYTIRNSDSNEIAILQFGMGLVGSAIKRAFDKRGDSITFHKRLPFNWEDIPQAYSEINRIFSFLKKIASEKSIHNVFIIWSAGKAGFSSTKEQTRKELTFFKAVVQKLSNDIYSLSYLSSRFILMSSAGGLFEGQTLVDKNSEVSPVRPYGLLKLSQEQVVQNNTYFDDVYILRLSSVYTNSNVSGRLGLIPVLIRNGIVNRVTTLVGNEYTLRDYVLDDDIGNYVIDIIISDHKIQPINYIINGKPSSILEIKNHIEKIVMRKLFINYSMIKSNASDISFSSKLKAKGFSNSPIQQNINKLFTILLSKNFN